MNNSTKNEQKLLCLMQQGDKEAFGSLYHTYWHDLYCTAFKRLQNRQQAEDIVEEVFISLWERRAELQIDTLAAYLHTAVRYKVYNYISRDAVTETFYEPYETMVIHLSNGEFTVIEKELQELANAYIKALPKKRKEIFTLYFDENLSTWEIAMQLKISQKTVQNQLGLAIKGLRSQILPVVSALILLLSSLR